MSQKQSGQNVFSLHSPRFEWQPGEQELSPQTSSPLMHVYHQKAKRICARANVIRYTNTSMLMLEKATCSRNRNMQCS